jgi:hypothetical protein
MMTARVKACLVAGVCLLFYSRGVHSEPELSASLHPVPLPIEISWSSRSGFGIRFVGPSIPTPLGVLNVGLSFHEAESAFPQRHILAIVIAAKTYVYDLGQESFVLELPNNIRGHATVEYDRGSIYLRIPHPDALRAPRRLDQAGASASRTLRTGTFAIELGEGFAFGAQKVTRAESSDVAYIPPSYLGPPPALQGHGLMDLGPVPLDSVRTVSEMEERPSNIADIFWGALTLRGLREGEQPKYYDGVAPIVGHTYALAITPHGPYALLRVLAVDRDDPDMLPNRVHCKYVFQSDGSRNF